MPRHDQSRDALVLTTAVLLRRQGYAATGLAQVLAESGATTGSLYHHFPGGKEALAEAAMDASAAVVAQALQRALAAPLSTGEAIERWLDALAAELAGDPRDGCPIAPVALEAVHASPRLQAAAARAFATWCDLIAARLRRDGRTPAQARSAALAVVSLVEGALLLARTSGQRAPLKAAATAAASLLG